MLLSSQHILKILGYVIDKKGNVHPGTTQFAVLSLENAEDGGVLRIHSDIENLFYSEDRPGGEQPLSFPSKITKNYVYFEGPEGKVRVETKEFIDSATIAIGQLNQFVQKRMAA